MRRSNAALYTPPDLATVRAVAAEHGMVVAQEKIAAQIGADILRQGGNAVDAAVATGFALAVTYPRAGNIGGGGFMVIHSAERNEDVAIDYRETAPAAATRDMYLGADGKPDTDKSRNSALGIGVPGTVAGLALALEKYGSGKFTLAQIIKPSIDLARDGFIVADDMADTLSDMYRRMARWPNSAKSFSRADGTPLRDGDRLIQADLAATLTAIAEQGPRGFYEGPVAEKLAKAVSDAGGIMTPDDLKSYQALIRAPVRGNYRGYDIVSMPLPSSGGTVLLETLNILEGFPMSDMKQGSAPSLHVMIEAMKRAYADRARYLGDPDFVNAPTQSCSPRIMPPGSAPASIPIARRHAADVAENYAATRGQQHHALFGGRLQRQRRQQHLHAELPLWRRPRRRRHRRAAQQRARRFHRRARRLQRLRAGRVSRPICPAPASGRCRRCRRPSC